MKITFARIWMYFWMLSVVFAFPGISYAMTRDEIMANAEKYRLHEWTPTENNVCHTSKIDTPDRNTFSSWPNDMGWKWTKSGGSYLANMGVPYNWGGASTLEDFDKGVPGGYCAGNKNTNFGLQKGTIGVDCSGFVSKSWNLKGKESTRSLPNITGKLGSYAELRKGDIVNSCGKHVMLCAEDNPVDSLYVYESSAWDWKVNNREYMNLDTLETQKYLPHSYSKNMDVELLFDESSSMDGRLAGMWGPARQFVDFLNVGDKIGVTSFRYYSSEDYRLTTLGKNNFSVVAEAAKTAIGSSPVGGLSAIGSGLLAAQDALNEYGVNEHGAKDRTRAIVLMSDGWENIEQGTADDKDVPSLLNINKVMIVPDEPGPSRVSEVLPGLIKDGIKVYTFGTGIQSNAPLLYDIAQKTGGKYYFMPQYGSFIDAFYKISSELSGRHFIRKMDYTISPFEKKLDQVEIDSGIQHAVYGISWPGSDMDLRLIAPDGKVIDHDTNNPNIAFKEGPTFESYEIQGPMTGKWQMEVYGKDVPAGGEVVSISVFGESGLIFKPEFAGAQYAQGDKVRVVASVQDPVLDIEDPQYVKAAVIEGEVVLPDESLATFKFFDDGLHGDGIAGDGVFGGDFTDTKLEGNYGFTIKASGKTNRAGDSFTREESETILVKKGVRPIAEAGGPYEGYVGTPIAFDAGKSFDPQGKLLQYRWDFDSDGKFDTEFSTSAEANHIFWNSYSGMATLEISNEVDSVTDTAIVNIIGAKDLKAQSVFDIGNITSARTLDKGIIKIAALFLNKSLDAKLWQDDSRLVTKSSSGASVFDMEAAATLQLQLLKMKSPQLKIALDKIIGKLVKADEILSKVLIEEKRAAVRSVVDSSKKKNAEKFLAKADDRYGAAGKNMNSGNPTLAIENFKLAWIFASQIEVPHLNVFSDFALSSFSQNVSNANNAPQQNSTAFSFSFS